jgi:glycosyltransferase involved in cell wall biosynthesis
MVLVDDGSPDQCGEICDSYARDNEKIHVIHQENKGQIAARQTAIRYVWQQSGLDKNQTYILYLDSDDSFKPMALQTIHDSIVKTECDLLIFGLDRVYDGKVLTMDKRRDEFIGEITDKRELYKLVFSSWAYNPLWRKAIQLSLYEDIDYSAYYHIKHGEDLLQSLPIYQNCQKAVFIGNALYDYTLNPDSITQSVTYENFRVDSTVRSTVLQFIKQERVMTDSDVSKYLGNCRHLMKKMIYTITSFNVGYSDKKGLFEIILNDSYYGFLLSETNLISPYLWLFKNRRYHLVIFIGKIRFFLGKLKRLVLNYSREV